MVWLSIYGLGKTAIELIRDDPISPELILRAKAACVSLSV